MDLNEMRLPELWTLYAAAVGEESRCPNRRFLIRRITEARAAPANGAPEAAGEALVAAATVVAPEATALILDGAPAADGSEEAHGQADAASDAPVAPAGPAELLTSNGVDPDQVAAGLDYHTAEDFGREDEDEIAANDAPATSAATPDGNAIPELSVATTELHAQKLSRLSVDELRVHYRDVVGRETGSSHAGYLQWKIREARKGRIKVGAIQRAPKPEGSAEKEMVVLPLRMPGDEVHELDKVWRQLGFASRTAFLRRAITDSAQGGVQLGFERRLDLAANHRVRQRFCGAPVLRCEPLVDAQRGRDPGGQTVGHVGSVPAAPGRGKWLRD